MDILTPETIIIKSQAVKKKQAIFMSGKLLVENGNITEEYIDAMYERDELVSVYMGNMLAIPHGVSDGQQYIKRTGMSLITFEDPIDFDGNDVQLVIAIAAKGDEHMQILAKLAILCSDIENVKKIIKMDDKEEIIKLIMEEEL